ncbi:MAG: PEP-CTERM sorting domain-containing protein [Chthonomonas sp.]|nr:PEP-CTERM sorting domain-containing protein [Chthonomonas sp.]
MKTFAFLALSAISASSFGLALDSASDAVYSLGMDYHNLNGGSGFQAWNNEAWNGGSIAISSEAAALGPRQFKINGGGIDTRRRLVNELVIGQSFNFSMMAGGAGIGNAQSAGEYGLEVRSTAAGSSGNREMLYLQARPSFTHWRVEGGDGWSSTEFTDVPIVAGQRVDVSLTVTGADSFSLFITNGTVSDTVNMDFISEGYMPAIMNFYADGSNNGSFYYNNLRTVPEPGTLLALGSLSAMIIRRRKARKA